MARNAAPLAGWGESPLERSIGLRPVDTLLADMGGDAELFRRLVGIFAEQTSERLAELHSALAARDGRSAEAAAHVLTGSLGYWGQGPAFDAARTVERSARDGNLAAACQHEDRLDREVRRVMLTLRRLANRI
jgi:HPt (histidine-containing phosphotransfer) domain-containing protein